ncbi:MAG: hypothetical protein ACRD8O_10650 [Bryobacteraceae bacterium]
MKLIVVFCLAATCVFAQGRGAGRGNTFGSPSGFGNVVFPGTGRPPSSTAGIFSGGSFAGRLGATVGGYPGYSGAPAGRHGGRSNVVVVPYFVGGGGYYADPYSQPPQNITIVVPPQQQMPQVVINQNFTPEVARPVVREYTTDPSDGVRIYESKPREQAQAPEEKKSVLIAFKDHTIYAAFSYWLEGDTLHYVTTHGAHNQVSLDLIDREFSERLNRERGVDFRIPRK